MFGHCVHEQVSTTEVRASLDLLRSGLLVCLDHVWVYGMHGAYLLIYEYM